MLYFIDISVFIANSADPDQTPRCAASDLGLHYFQITLLGVSRLKWVKTCRGNRMVKNIRDLIHIYCGVG